MAKRIGMKPVARAARWIGTKAVDALANEAEAQASKAVQSAGGRLLDAATGVEGAGTTAGVRIAQGLLGNATTAGFRSRLERKRYYGTAGGTAIAPELIPGVIAGAPISRAQRDMSYHGLFNPN